MRWEESVLRLFDDLEMQAQGLHLEQRAGEVAALAEAGYMEVSLASRVHSSVGSALRVRLREGTEVRGRLARAGADWILLDAGASEWLVRLAAVVIVDGLGVGSLSPDLWPMTARLSVRAALRGISETGAGCVFWLLDGRQAVGRLVRVGADFVELESGTELLIVPIGSVAAAQGRR